MSRNDHIQIQLKVNASFIMTLGAYGGPITTKAIADQINSQIAEDGIENYIDGWMILAVEDEQSTTPLAETTNPL